LSDELIELDGNGGGRMYKKALINGEWLYFVYGPPQTYLDTKSNRRLPKPPYTGAPRELSSVYYYWWAFLRLNESYIECCDNGGQGTFAELSADFRDVRGEDFVEWWKERGAHCFAEPQQTEYVTVLNAAPATYDPNSALISVPLAADIEETLKMLRYKLKPLFDWHRENYGHFSRARYKVFTKPVLSSLDQILRVKKAEIDNPNATDHQLAEIVGLNIGNENARDGQDVVQMRSHRVHTCLRDAERLIANVVKGRFPDFSDPNKPKRPEIQVDFDTL
jgi:hypothetical protein